MVYQRDSLLAALATVTAARRDAQAELDEHVSAKLTAGPSTDEQDEQSLASMVRLFDGAAKAVRDAVSCGDRLEERVRAQQRAA